MCGTPHPSRTTRTGADSPSTTILPATSGVSGAGGGSRRHATSAADAHSERAITLTRMTIKDALLMEYDHEVGTTRRLLERLPEAELAWKPHEKSMSLGGL